MTTPDDSHVLYRMHGHDGDLLYVGITCRPPSRFKNHRNTKDWWSEVATIGVTTLASRDELLAMERQAIRTEAPRYNVMHNRRLTPRALPADDPTELPPAESDDSARLLTIQQTADVLRLSKVTVYRLFDSGDLQWVQIGAHRRVPAAELDRFIVANTRQAS